MRMKFPYRNLEIGNTRCPFNYADLLANLHARVEHGIEGRARGTDFIKYNFHFNAIYTTSRMNNILITQITERACSSNFIRWL